MIEHVKAGKLRALAVTTASRLDVLPDTPTVADFVPGYEASGFAGIGAPRGTPADIIELLNKELNAGLADSKVKSRIVELGGTVLGGSPAEFGTIIAQAIEKWANVIKFAGIKVGSVETAFRGARALRANQESRTAHGAGFRVCAIEVGCCRSGQ